MAKIDFSGSSLVRGKWIESGRCIAGGAKVRRSSLVRGKWIESFFSKFDLRDCNQSSLVRGKWIERFDTLKGAI